MDHDELPRVLSSSTEFESHVFDVRRSLIRFPDGHEAERVVVEHPGAVALVALDDAGRWLLVRQYRHPAGRALLEIPAGTRDGDESPEETAAREVREETGYAAGRLERLGGAWSAPGFCSEYLTFYLATELRADPLAADADEYLSEPVPMSVEEIRRAIVAGDIEDAKTLAALTLYELHDTSRGR